MPAVKEKKITGNQYITDPRQELFLKLYFDPKSETFGNCKQSALKANYSLDYAENLMSLMPEWLLDNIELNHRNKLSKVEKNLDEFLDLDYIDENGKKDPQLAKIKQGTTHFIAETLGRKHYAKAIGNPIGILVNINRFKEYE